LLFEVDCNTESAGVWKRKIQGYLELARSGTFTQAHNLVAFRVLVVAETEDRIQAIRSMVALYTGKVFWVATTKNIKSEGFWSACWLRPTGDQRHSLV
jgi:hypothetical protein